MHPWPLCDVRFCLAQDLPRHRGNLTFAQHQEPQEVHGRIATMTGASYGMGAATLDGYPSGELRIIDHGAGVPARKVLAGCTPRCRPATAGGHVSTDDAPTGNRTRVLVVDDDPHLLKALRITPGPRLRRGHGDRRRHSPECRIPPSAGGHSGASRGTGKWCA